VTDSQSLTSASTRTVVVEPAAIWRMSVWSERRLFNGGRPSVLLTQERQVAAKLTAMLRFAVCRAARLALDDFLREWRGRDGVGFFQFLWPQEPAVSVLGIIVVVILLLVLFGGLGGGSVLPYWGYGYGFGHGGVGVVGIILIVVVILALMGRL